MVFGKPIPKKKKSAISRKIKKEKRQKRPSHQQRHFALGTFLKESLKARKPYKPVRLLRSLYTACSKLDSDLSIPNSSSSTEHVDFEGSAIGVDPDLVLEQMILFSLVAVVRPQLAQINPVLPFHRAQLFNISCHSAGGLVQSSIVQVFFNLRIAVSSEDAKKIMC